jgi:hypothetical protein
MKSMILVLSILLAQAITSVVGLAQEDDTPTADSDAVAPSAASDDCFSIRQSRTMSALHDRYIYLESGGQSFLLQMGGTCPGLRNAGGIRMNPRFPDRVCSSEFYAIRYRPFGTSPETNCLVLAVKAVENREEAKALVAERTE